MQNSFSLLTRRRARPRLARRLAALALLAPAGAALAQTPATFAPVTNYATGAGSGSYSVAVADVNGDGRRDIVTANGGSSTVGVLLGQAGGGFAAVTTYSTGAGNRPTGVAVADMNGDGRLDIITANSFSNSAGVLLGKAGGGFANRVNYDTGPLTSPQAVAVADVNGDGRPDIVTANNNSNNYSAGVLLGQAGGGFAPIVRYYTGNFPYAVTVADVNADGRPDILTANASSSSVGVLLGQAGGGFAPVVAYSTGANNPYGIAVADVNGDGRPDVVTTSRFTDTAGVLLGQAGGGFAALTTYSVGAGGAPYGVAVADLNGDGRPDIVTANNSGNTAGVLLNTTGVISTPTVTTAAPSGVAATTATLGGDVTNDGNSPLLERGVVYVAGTGTPTTADTKALVQTSGVTTGSFSGTVSGLTATTQYTVRAYASNSQGTSYGSGQTFTTTAPATAFTVSGGTLASPTPIPAGTYTTITVPTGTVGQLGGAVSVTTGVSVQNGGTLLTNCQPLTGSGSFTVAAGATLGICDAAGLSATAGTGAVQTTGTRSFSDDATYLYNGTVAQATGNALPAQVRELNVSTTGGNLTLTNDLAIGQVVRITTPDFNYGNLDLGGRALTLRSGSAGTALLVNAGNGSVLANTGTCRMERYIEPGLNPGAGYRHFSSPTPGMTIGQLATAGFAPVLTAAYNTSATPNTTTPFPNVFGYDQTRLTSASNSNLPDFDKGWVVPTATTAMATATGYTVNLPASAVVTFSGTAFNQAQHGRFMSPGRGPQADAGWALVGNPYPSPFDLSVAGAQSRINLDAASYVFESTGQYGGQYRTYINGIGTNSLLAAGQGFFVRMTTVGQNSNIAFARGGRLTSFDTQAPFRRTAADARPQVALRVQAGTLSDEAHVYAETGATPGLDPQFDAVKMANSSGLNLTTLAASGEQLAIQGLPAIVAGTALPLTLALPAAGTTRFTATVANLPAGLTAFLTDALTGTRQDLAAQPTYAFAAAQAGTVAGRFALVFGPAAGALATTTAKANALALYPSPARTAATLALPATAQARPVQLLDGLGRVVRHATLPANAGALALDLSGLPAGVYAVRCGTATARLVVE